MIEELEMISEVPNLKILPASKSIVYGILVFLGLLIFCALFLLLDNIYFRYVDARFPSVGTSVGLATIWGIVQRAHLLIFIIPLVLWHPKPLGFQIGRISQHWRMLLIMLLLNCGVIATYLWLTSSSTPYSDNIWFITEVVTAPFVEEVFWRGIVFMILQFVFTRLYTENTGNHLAVWLSGLSFGLMHGNNLLAGVPLAFVIIQVLNATVWGMVYGYARSKTASVYPAMFLHAAMNLVVILF
jgi:membrane protease YdiL (CAAX protease family)